MKNFRWAIILSTFLSGMSPLSGQAYYQVNEKPKDIFFQREKNYVPWGDQEKRFALYDNFNHLSSKQNRGSIVCPYTDAFSPFDEIRWNLPLRISIRQPLSLEYSLANMLYANLKLNKLVEEYMMIQKNAQELIAYSAGPKSKSRGTLSPAQIDGLSIHQRVGRLNIENQNIQRRAVPQAGWAEEIPLANVESLRSLVNRREEIAETPLALFLPQSPGEDNKAGSKAENQNTPRSEPLQPIAKERTDLPWIFQGFFGIIKYFLANKLEALLYGSVLLLFLAFLLSMKPK